MELELLQIQYQSIDHTPAVYVQLWFCNQDSIAYQ